jgi:hypothetical protein
VMKDVYGQLWPGGHSCVDKSVYRIGGGLFRTIYSDKSGAGRPFISDRVFYEDSFSDIETFVGYILSDTPYIKVLMWIKYLSVRLSRMFYVDYRRILL